MLRALLLSIVVASPAPPLLDEAEAARSAIVEQLAQDQATERNVEALAEALLAGGAAATGPLFDVLVAGAVPAEWRADGVPVRLDAEALTAVRRALLLVPDELRKHLAQVAARPTRTDREITTALDLIGGFGDAHDLPLCVDLATPGAEESRLPRTRRVAFEAAVARLMERDADVAWVLKGLFASLHPSLLAPAVRCIGQDPTPENLQLLSGLLQRVPGIDDYLLAEIAQVARHVPRPIDDMVFVHVRYLLGSDDQHEVVLAVQALGELDDYDSIGRLIEMLGTEDERLAKAADTALEHMTGRRYAGSHRWWSQWHAFELDWWRDGSGSLRMLNDRDPRVVLGALHDISGHRLYRHEIAEAVAGVLDRPEPELVAIACSILKSLDSPVPVDDLIEALRYASPEASTHVLSALQALTGQGFAADYGLWSDWAR